MITIKKCKGSGKAINSGCGTKTDKRTYGLCNKCYIDWLLTTDNGKLKMERSRIKAKKIVDRQERNQRKFEKEKISDYKSKLQDKVNEIVRLIDYGLPCLAKGIHAKQMHAGHVYSRGSNATMRYNLHNIHRQSAQSNHFQNEDGLLREGLQNEYGQNYFNFISELRRTPPLKLSNAEYNTLYRNACKIALKMRRDGKVYNNVEARIEERNQINIKLNIYRFEYCVFNPF